MKNNAKLSLLALSLALGTSMAYASMTFLLSRPVL